MRSTAKTKSRPCFSYGRAFYSAWILRNVPAVPAWQAADPSRDTPDTERAPAWTKSSRIRVE